MVSPLTIRISEPNFGNEEQVAAIRVLGSGLLSQGEEVDRLEREVAGYCGVQYAVAVANGTAALHTALSSAGVTEGDEVITTPFTFVATANSILMQRARIVFADINESDFCINPSAVAEKTTSSTKAIIPVDLYGQTCDYGRLGELASEHGIAIIEDACQALGASFLGKKAGSFGSAGIFSLYATKNITCGEGGIMVTGDERMAERARRFRNQGQARRYEYNELGYNYRLTELAAAIALEQFKKLDQVNRQRNNNAAALSAGLAGIRGLVTPVVREGYEHAFHQYTIRITDECKKTRAQIAAQLSELGIQTGNYYPKPLHFYAHLNHFGFKAGDFPVAEKFSQEVLSLPVHPGLSGNDIDFIIHSIRLYAT